MAKIKYLVIGGVAVNFYGYHRMTGDLDVWIAVEPQNLEKVSQVLQQFGGFPASKVPASMFAEPDRVFRFGIAPVAIDIFTSPLGVDFGSCYARKVDAQYAGITIPFVSLEDLKVSKRSAGRLKDREDLENLPPNKPKRSKHKRKQK